MMGIHRLPTREGTMTGTHRPEAREGRSMGTDRLPTRDGRLMGSGTGRNKCLGKLMNRRQFVAGSAGCASWIAGAAAFLSPSALRAWSDGRGGMGASGPLGVGGQDRQVVARTPFARIEQLGDGLYAIVSTPLDGDYTTVCNGGIIGGREGTIVVESFATPEGGAWAARQARELTGRWPTHLIVTHYHGDHAAGVAGFAQAGAGAEEPELRTTETTRELVVGGPGDAAANAPWADMVVVPEDGPVEIDLGGVVASVAPRGGHTASDLTVEVRAGGGGGVGVGAGGSGGGRGWGGGGAGGGGVGGSGEGGGPAHDEAEIIWCGDLVWNAMFPNFVDAAPTRLSREVRRLAGRGAATFVPGHGPVADATAMSRYVALLDSVEEAARAGWRRGMSADEVADSYEVPAGLGEWVMFNPNYYLRAVQAWMGEVG